VGAEDSGDTEDGESEDTEDTEVSSIAEGDTFKIEFVKTLRVVNPNTLRTPMIRLPLDTFSGWFEPTPAW
jgi:hypothetical protein